RDRTGAVARGGAEGGADTGIALRIRPLAVRALGGFPARRHVLSGDHAGGGTGQPGLACAAMNSGGAQAAAVASRARGSRTCRSRTNEGGAVARYWLKIHAATRGRSSRRVVAGSARVGVSIPTVRCAASSQRYLRACAPEKAA